MNLNDYLIIDGKHATALEAERYEEEEGKPFPLGKDGIQKVYKFPNGYGASVIKGWFSQDLWEIIVVGFEDKDSDEFAIIGDILRFDTFEEIEMTLELIFKYGVKQLDA